MGYRVVPPPSGGPGVGKPAPRGPPAEPPPRAGGLLGGGQPPELSSTQSRYCVASATAFQLKVGVAVAMLPEGATRGAAPGGALSAPRPVTRRERLAPFAVKVRLTPAAAAGGGLKRTATACGAPTPTRL